MTDLNGEMPLIATGTILDEDFEIGELIGGGGFGRIYEAYQHSLDMRKVIIKFEKFSPYWQNDASVLARINSKFFLPEVYKKFELVDEEGKKYVCLVMEYIKGETIESIIKNLPPDAQIPIERVVKWISQLCDALGELHNKNIIHADVKPGNIMVDENDDICLIDFNTAIINKRIGVWGLCVSNGYSPPEQYATPVSEASGHGKKGLEAFGGNQSQQSVKWIPGTADETSDLYTAGAVLYYLLFKRRPQTSEKRTSHKFITERSGLIKDYAPFYNIIEKATALTPSKRYQSAEEMKTAVNRAYKRMLFWTKKTKLIVVACVLVGVMAISGGAIALMRLFLSGQTVYAGAFDLYEKGNELIESGDFEGAEKIFNDNIENFDAHDAQIFLYALQAEALCGKGEYERYISEYENYPDSVKNYTGRYNDFYSEILFYAGEAYSATEKFSVAADFYNKASLAYNEQIDYKKALMRTLAILGEVSELERIKAELSDAQAAQIGDDWLYFFDGVAKKASKEFTEAEEDFLKASVTNDGSLLWAVVYECSSMFSEINENEKQIAFLSDKRMLFPSISMSVIVNERLGDSLRKVGRLEDALECYEYLVELQPFSYRSLELLASIMDEMKRYDEEMAILDRMIALSQQNIRAYTLYVNALLKTEDAKPYEERDFTKAYEMFKKAEGIEPNNSDVVIYRDIFDNLGLNDLLQNESNGA